MNGIATLLLLVSFLFIGLRAIWLRERLNDAFAKHVGDTPTLAELRDQLSLVNSECSTFVFSALRRANISFRDRRIALVYGPVGSVVLHGRGNSWHAKNCVFTVSPNDQKDWLLAQPDVFTPAFIGSQFSVFWTSLSKF